MTTFTDDQRRESWVGMPFDVRSGEYRLARDEYGVLFHQPSCPEFKRRGWCEHMSEAHLRASTPIPAFYWEAQGVLERWRVGDFERPLRAVAGEIANMAYDAQEREKALRDWQARVPLEGEAS